MMWAAAVIVVLLVAAVSRRSRSRAQPVSVQRVLVVEPAPLWPRQPPGWPRDKGGF